MKFGLSCAPRTAGQKFLAWPYYSQRGVCVSLSAFYPRRARSALGVDIVLTLDVCLYVTALERKRLIGMT